MRVIVVGAGGITRDLLRRLGERWQVALIDPDPNRLKAAAEIRPIETEMGDGSSRVVLMRSGLANCDVLVAATNDDEVNLETCRLGIEAGVPEVVAVAADPERQADYRQLGVTAVSPDRVAARHLEITMEPRRVSSAAFAEGKAEAVEFRIGGDSPLRGRPLRELHLGSWLVAAVLRRGDLIIPHGGTVLEEGDLVTVVAAATDYGDMVARFTGGQPRFPLDFGKRVAVVVRTESGLDATVAEAVYFTRVFAAESLLVLHEDLERLERTRASLLEDSLSEIAELAAEIEVHRQPLQSTGATGIQRLVQNEGIGVLVSAAPTVGGLMGRLSAVRILRGLTAPRIPLLLSRGVTRYERLLVPVPEGPTGWAAAEAAMDLANEAALSLVGVAIVPPPFLVGADALPMAREAASLFKREAAVRGVDVEIIVEQANPVRAVAAMAEESLLVLPFPRRPPNLIAPGFVSHLARRARGSVLLVPSHREPA